jgi:hypothetical protein
MKWGILIAVAVLGSGCKGKDSDKDKDKGKDVSTDKTDKKPGDGKVTSDKPAAKDCPADHTKNEAGGFCIKLPADFTAKPEQKMGDTQTVYSYGNANNSDSVSITVNAFDEARYDMEVKAKTEVSEAQKGTSGDLPDGAGKFWVYDKDGDTYSKSITRNAASYILCETRTGTADTTVATRIEYCKSLMAL